MLQIKVITLVLLTLVISQSYQLNLNFLRAFRRFNTESIDAYYSCTTCGWTGLQWFFNNQSAGGYLIRTTTVGAATIASNGPVLFSSMLLSVKRQEDGRVCLDSVLIVTLNPQDHRDMEIEVTCRDDDQQNRIRSSLATLGQVRRSTNSESGEVKLDYVLFNKNVVHQAPTELYTHLFMCYVSGRSQDWKFNGAPAGGFREPNIPGNKDIQTFTEYNHSVVNSELLLVEKSSQYLNLTSVFVVNSNQDFSVVCRGVHEYANFSVSDILESDFQTTTNLGSIGKNGTKDFSHSLHSSTTVYSKPTGSNFITPTPPSSSSLGKPFFYCRISIILCTIFFCRQFWQYLDSYFISPH